MPRIEVQNMVAFVDLNTELDLERLAFELPHSEYVPDRFPALVVKFKKPKISFLVFRNGKINCTGADQVDSIEQGVAKLAEQLRDLDIEIQKDPKIKVVNVVATVDLGLTMNLDEIALNIENVEYEPEQFPGLVYRPYQSKASVLVFTTGKLVIAGLKDRDQVRGVVDRLMERLTKAGLA